MSRQETKRAGRTTLLEVTSETGSRSIPVSEARQRLCPLLKEVDGLPGGRLGISVAGDVSAYLISARRLEELERRAEHPVRARRPLRGSLEIVGDLDDVHPTPSEELERMALESWDRQQ